MRDEDIAYLEAELETTQAQVKALREILNEIAEEDPRWAGAIRHRLTVKVDG